MSICIQIDSVLSICIQIESIMSICIQIESVMSICIQIESIMSICIQIESIMSICIQIESIMSICIQIDCVMYKETYSLCTWKISRDVRKYFKKKNISISRDKISISRKWNISISRDVRTGTFSCRRTTFCLKEFIRKKLPKRNLAIWKESYSYTKSVSFYTVHISETCGLALFCVSHRIQRAHIAIWKESPFLRHKKSETCGLALYRKKRSLYTRLLVS